MTLQSVYRHDPSCRVWRLLHGLAKSTQLGGRTQNQARANRQVKYPLATSARRPNGLPACAARGLPHKALLTGASHWHKARRAMSGAERGGRRRFGARAPQTLRKTEPCGEIRSESDAAPRRRCSPRRPSKTALLRSARVAYCSRGTQLRRVPAPDRAAPAMGRAFVLRPA